MFVWSGNCVQSMKYSKLIPHSFASLMSVASGGVEGQNVPASVGKIVVENWCYVPGVYTFGEKAELQEIFSR